MGAALLAGAVPSPDAMTILELPCSCAAGDCGKCRGGKVMVNTVPVTFAQPALPTIRAYRWLHQHGVLPSAGGMLDQSNAFIEACEIIDSEISGHEATRIASQEVIRGRK